MGGRAIYDAAKAIVDEIVFFCPSEKQATLRKMLQKGRDVELAMIAVADKKLDNLDPGKLSEILLNGPATNSPESSASIPADGPSVDSLSPPEPATSGSGSTPAALIATIHNAGFGCHKPVKAQDCDPTWKESAKNEDPNQPPRLDRPLTEEEFGRHVAEAKARRTRKDREVHG